jgi:hypothetical protein
MRVMSPRVEDGWPAEGMVPRPVFFSEVEKAIENSSPD